MKTDLYTKSVLTVIAVCLFVNTFTPYNFMSKDHANEILSSPTEVRIVGVDPTVRMGIDVQRILGWYPAIQHYSYTPEGKKSMSPIVIIGKD